jgi:hypothetical protein
MLAVNRYAVYLMRMQIHIRGRTEPRGQICEDVHLSMYIGTIWRRHILFVCLQAIKILEYFLSGYNFVLQISNTSTRNYRFYKFLVTL